MYKLKNIPDHPEYRWGVMPLDSYIKKNAERVPNKTAYLFYGSEITYGQLDEYIDRMASFLADLGVVQGDTVGLFMQNCPQFSIAFFAVQRLGAIISPFSPMFKEWDLEFELNELDAKVIIANTYLYPIVANVRDKTKVKHVILSDLEYFVAENNPIPWTFPLKGEGGYQDCIMMMEALKETAINVPAVERDMEDVSLIMFTSGTTGLPKGAMLTYMNALYKTVGCVHNFYFHEQMRLLHTQPMCHIAGMVFVNEGLYLGATSCILTAATPESICAAVQEYKISHWYATSMLAKMVIDYPGAKNYFLHSLRVAITSGFGIPTSQELIDEWYEFIPGSEMQEAAFGLTETHTADTLMPPELKIVGGNGIPPFADSFVKIMENGKECAPGEVGEIVLKNKGVFKGYLNNQEATDEILKDGWLHTGDAGILDEQGYLYFQGRRKEMIKSSGFSVFPDEVEMYMGRHEAVEKVLVIGKPDDRKGEIIKAFVILRPEYKGKITEEELVEWSKDKMANYKRPREVEFRDSLPMNNTGKLLRKVLKEEELEKLGKTAAVSTT